MAKLVGPGSKRYPATERFQTFLSTLVGRALDQGDAGLILLEPDSRVDDGPPTQAQYEYVLAALATIRLHKVNSYGESRYHPESARYNLALAYGDLERKMIRLKHQIFSPEPLTAQVVEDLIAEAGADLANYAVLLVQLCGILLEQGLTEVEEQK